MSLGASVSWVRQAVMLVAVEEQGQFQLNESCEHDQGVKVENVRSGDDQVLLLKNEKNRS